MTWTTLPGVEPLLAGTFSDVVTDLRPLHVFKSSDETLSNSTTLQNDNELLLSVAVETYDVEAMIYYGAGTTADFKTAFTFPSATFYYSIANLDTALAATQTSVLNEASGSSRSMGGAGVGSFRYAWFRGRLAVTTAGTLQFQWAQNSAVVEDTVVKAGSWMTLRQVV